MSISCYLCRRPIRIDTTEPYWCLALYQDGEVLRDEKGTVVSVNVHVGCRERLAATPTPGLTESEQEALAL